MKKKLLIEFLFLCIFFPLVTYSAVSEPEDMPVPPLIPSLEAPNADWVFSGVVANENGEQYPYYFHIHRQGNQYDGVATLIDGETHTLLIQEESHAIIEKGEALHRQVGTLFMRFNPITTTWVFGVNRLDKKGFNFKVDLLGMSHAAFSKPQMLREDVALSIIQTGRLNGHIRRGDNQKEQFVTAKQAWFQQVWLTQPQVFPHRLMSLLCSFYDGSALYSVTLQEPDAARGAIVGLRDERGASLPVSQFLRFEEGANGIWFVHIDMPKMVLSLHDVLQGVSQKTKLVAGIVTGSMPGFCSISHDNWVAE